jgi:hypothetical protein
MKNQKEDRHSLQLLIQLQKLSSNKRQSGYAMLMVSVMSILIFSMLSVYLFSSRMSRATANAIIDSGSTFYAAEYGLNRRANIIRSKIGNFSRPSGNSPTGLNPSEMMESCLGNNSLAKGTDDFACREDLTSYQEAVLTGGVSASGSVSVGSNFQTSANIKYKSYSFIKEVTPSINVTLTPITTGDYRGLRSLDYRYRVYSTALKQSTGSTNVSAQSMLQMEFVDRFIPIFQFAAFYDGDLELNSGTTLSIDGKIHTNGNLYMAPSELLTLNDNATFVGNAYRSLQYSSGDANYPAGLRSILFTGAGQYSSGVEKSCASGNHCIDANVGWNSASNAFPYRISDADAAVSGKLSRQNTLLLPPRGFLSKVDSSGKPGGYFTQAELRVDFINGSPPTSFNITRLNQTTTPATEVENFSFTIGLLPSLQKPVILRVTADNNRSFSEIARLCPKLDGTQGEPVITATNKSAALRTPSSTMSTLSPYQRQQVIVALQTAIAKTNIGDSSLDFNNLQGATAKAIGNSAGQLKYEFRTAARAIGGGLTTTQADNIVDNGVLSEIIAWETDNISGVKQSNGGCFLPAPMTILTGQRDKKEGRDLSILQSNIKSLTVWNRDGVYWGDPTPAPTVPPATTPPAASGTPSLLPTRDKLFVRKVIAPIPTADSTAAVPGARCDYDCMGLGAIDTTNGGLVWHYSMSNKNDYTIATGTTRATSGSSPYAFAFTGATRLPGPLTIASDQAVYIQGDFNNPSSVSGDLNTDLDLTRFTARTASTNPAANEKRPAAVMSDSAIALSNDCYDSTTYKLNCLTNWGTVSPPGSTTVIRAAVLSGTESTLMSGSAGVATEVAPGLNNHLSFREGWWTGPTRANRSTLKYRGSLVSKGIPTEFNGQFFAGCSNPTNCNGRYYSPPNRDIGFDTDFTLVDGLPPLTPNVNLLQQKVYKRDYDPRSR